MKRLIGAALAATLMMACASAMAAYHERIFVLMKDGQPILVHKIIQNDDPKLAEMSVCVPSPIKPGHDDCYNGWRRMEGKGDSNTIFYHALHGDMNWGGEH